MKLREALIAHRNGYPELATRNNSPLPSLSVVIPYYDSPTTLSNVLRGVQEAIQWLHLTDPYCVVETIVVDDGSKNPPDATGLELIEKHRMIRLEKNKGRTVARNMGLAKATGQVIMFLDADIIIDRSCLLEHLTVQAQHIAQGVGCITVGFFKNEERAAMIKFPLLADDVRPDDFRLCCEYKKAWIGNNKDLAFVGKRLSPVYDTSMFRNWPKNGYYGPWMLPNMVLGGLFAVQRERALKVHGFNILFKGYGFTETSLPTKLIAYSHDFVVPILKGGGIHLYTANSDLTRDQKDDQFKKKHSLYFNTFLEYSIEEAIYADASHDLH